MKKNLIYLTAALLLCTVSCQTVADYFEVGDPPVTDDRSWIRLNEINADGEDKDKYIEIYNYSGAQVDLEGYKIRMHNDKTNEYTLAWTGRPGDRILSLGYFVVKGTQENGDITYNFNTLDGICVELLDQNDEPVDYFQVIRMDAREQEGARVPSSYARIPDGHGFWYFESTAGTRDITNGTDTDAKIMIDQKAEISLTPTIEDLTVSPDQPAPGQSVTVSAKVSSPDGDVNKVELTYWYDGVGETTLSMTGGSAGYSVTMPSDIPDFTFVSFRIKAENSIGGTSALSNSYYVSSVTPEITGALYINECDPWNKQWEIYNPGTDAINLEGWTLTSYLGEDDQTEYRFPARTIIPPGSYTVFQQNVGNGPTFGLPATGGFRFTLKNRDGEVVDTFDNIGANVVNENIEAGHTLGRLTDAVGNIRTFERGSVGAANAEGMPYSRVVAAGFTWSQPGYTQPTYSASVNITLEVNLTRVTESDGVFTDQTNMGGFYVNSSGVTSRFYFYKKAGTQHTYYCTWSRAPAGVYNLYWAVPGTSYNVPLEGTQSRLSVEFEVFPLPYDFTNLKISEINVGDMQYVELYAKQTSGIIPLKEVTLWYSIVPDFGNPRAKWLKFWEGTEADEMGPGDFFLIAVKGKGADLDPNIKVDHVVDLETLFQEYESYIQDEYLPSISTSQDFTVHYPAVLYPDRALKLKLYAPGLDPINSQWGQLVEFSRTAGGASGTPVLPDYSAAGNHGSFEVKFFTYWTGWVVIDPNPRALRAVETDHHGDLVTTNP